MGKSSSAPAAPDPAKIIPLQAEANKDAFNYTLDGMRADEYTPYGSSTWSKESVFDQAGYDKALADWQASQSASPISQSSTPDPTQDPWGYWRDLEAANAGGTLPSSTSTTPSTAGQPSKDDFYSDKWTRRVQLSPEQQALLDGQNKIAQEKIGMTDMLMGRVKDAYGPDGVEIPGFEAQSVNYDQDSRRRVEEALMSRFKTWMDPEFDKAERSSHNLASQMGFNARDDGYSDYMRQFYDRKDKAYADAEDRAVILGGQEATGELARALQSAQFGARENDRERSYAIDDRGRPLNELNAFLTGSQVTMPQTQGQYSAPNLQAPDIMGAYQQQYDNLLGASNADQASSDNFLSGLMGIGGAMLGGPAGSAGAMLLSKLLA